MNQKFQTRLQNVVQALYDADKVPFFKRTFTMRRWGFGNAHSEQAESPNCGAPACAFGHYASRTDLQRTFYLDHTGEVVDKATGADACQEMMKDHFGLNDDEFHNVFGSDGCGGATTPGKAAAWINKFLMDKFAEAQAPEKIGA